MKKLTLTMLGLITPLHCSARIVAVLPYTLCDGKAAFLFRRPPQVQGSTDSDTAAWSMIHDYARPKESLKHAALRLSMTHLKRLYQFSPQFFSVHPPLRGTKTERSGQVHTVTIFPVHIEYRPSSWLANKAKNPHSYDFAWVSAAKLYEHFGGITLGPLVFPTVIETLIRPGKRNKILVSALMVKLLLSSKGPKMKDPLAHLASITQALEAKGKKKKKDPMVYTLETLQTHEERQLEQAGLGPRWYHDTRLRKAAAIAVAALLLYYTLRVK